MRDAAYAHPALVTALAMALAGSAGCAVRSPEATTSGQTASAPDEALGIALPTGAGRALVIAACTPCHDLGGIAAFKGYWNREQWASMVATMIEHGAELDEREAGLVVDYLAAHFGDGTASASGERAGAAMERYENGGLTR